MREPDDRTWRLVHNCRDAYFCLEDKLKIRLMLISLILVLCTIAEAQNKSLLYQSGRGLIWRYQGGGAAPDVGTPVAWYKMTGTDTNATQLLDSANSYNVSNMPSVATGPTITNMSPYAYCFDGSDDYFDGGDVFNFTTTFAVSLWVNLDSITYHCPLNIWSSTASEQTFRLFFSSERYIYFGLKESDGGSVLINSTSDWPVGSWQYITVIADGSYVKLFTNCVCVASNTYDGTINSTSAPFIIGKQWPSAYLLDGYIDDVRLFNTLSIIQMQNIYAAGRQ